MFQDHATVKENFERFLKRVLERESVWGLRGASGFETCESNEDGRDIILFWSDAAYARRATKADFPHATPEEVSLFDFMFRWLPGMDADRVLVGPNYTANLCGLELEPLELQNDLIDGLTDAQRSEYRRRLEERLAEQGGGKSCE